MTARTTRQIVLALMACAMAGLPSLAIAIDFSQERTTFIQAVDAAVFGTRAGAAQAAAFENLHQRAAELVKAHPSRAEPLVLQAWALHAHSQVKGPGMSALLMGRKALDKLEAAIAMDPDVYGAATYTSLGAMYVAVCDLPFAIGCMKKGRTYLDKALRLEPTGGEQHLWYAEMLFKDKDFAGALVHVRTAAAAPARPGREAADQRLQKQVLELANRIEANMQR